jgi:hypothetical protein
MVDMKKRLPETKAGQELYQTLEALIKQQQVHINKIRAETKRENDENILLILKAEYKVIGQQLADAVAGANALKLPVGKRFLRFLSGPATALRRRW